jgi:aminomethyltransferase
MPLQYSGVIEEHVAVRGGVGVFDVSHLGTVDVTGPGAATLVNEVMTNDLARVGPGQAQYTLCCTERGGVVDDLIVYLDSPDRLRLVPNAANSADVVRRLAEAAPAEVTVTDRHREVAVLAVQGPASAAVVSALGLPTSMGYMAFTHAQWQGSDVTVCRTGYTGEHGYELLVPAPTAGSMWDALLAAGDDAGVVPCGLAARDTLRTEMGYPLHGNDLSLDITPVQARLRWAIGWDKPAFVGKAALVAERTTGPSRVLRGLIAQDRSIPRPGMAVRAAHQADSADAAVIGMVTSGTFSPSLRVGIALALLDAAVVDGDEVVVDVRGRPGAFTVTKPPFVKTSPT